MLKVFRGPSKEKDYLVFCDSFRKKNPSAQVLTLDADNPEFESVLGELVLSRDLFGTGVLCHGRRVLGATKLPEKDFENSAITFAFFEPEEKAKGKDVNKYDGPNLFVVADKLASKDKRAVWVEYQRLLLAGVNPEEVYFKLQWQVRAMLAARASGSPAEAGLKDYPFQKAKSAQTKFVGGELEKFSNELLMVWHLGHGGGRDFALELEQFVLNM